MKTQKEIDFDKCEINPKGWEGYVKIVYKETPNTAHYKSVDEDTLKVITKLKEKVGK